MKFAKVCCFAALLFSLVGCEDEVLCRDPNDGSLNCWTGECIGSEQEIQRFSWSEFDACSAAQTTNQTSGGEVGGDCATSCPQENPGDVQLDSFCQAACCYRISGQPSYAEQTCEAGSFYGTRESCQDCR